MAETYWRRWCAVGAVLLCAVLAPASQADTIVKMTMNLSDGGNTDVFIRLFDADRPLTTANFLQYVNGGLYDGSFFHRLVPGFVLQGGGFLSNIVANPTAPDPFAEKAIAQDPVDLDGDSLTPNPTVLNEFDNLPFRSNVRGTLAMAKLGGDPDSATNQWFFNLADNSANLDNQNGGFTVFAEVIGNGMDLIDAFASFNTFNLNPDDSTFGAFGNLILPGVPDGIRDPGPFADVPSAELLPDEPILLEITQAQVVGDFTNDGNIDAADIDMLWQNLGDPAFEVNGDGVVDQGDVDDLVQIILGTLFGDANLNGTVNFTDFTDLRDNVGLAGGWAQGDFNGDGMVSFADFGTALQPNFGMPGGWAQGD
ncbi:MAG: peptidylprolyl isomerase, partial [Phycisphaeraceae bacterium]